jgi:BirA family biotin operon repressor/biotin-[acetyl-CoA-carboxylase] ligase
MALQIFHFKTLDSTMTKARDLARSNIDTPFAVTADVQTEGRGRVEGRRWETGGARALLCTLCLRLDDPPPPAASLRLAIAVAEALIDHYKIPSSSGSGKNDLLIKWPNDLMGRTAIDGSWKKLGGMLCEFSRPWFFVGIGINLFKNSYPQSLHQRATSLEEILGASPFVDHDMPEEVVTKIEGLLEAYLESEDWKNRYESLLWARGSPVDFLVGHPGRNQYAHGIIEGVDDSGRLMLRDNDGTIRLFSSGEVTGIRLA